MDTLKIWIDILTPKQLLFFTPLIDRLERLGHTVLLTSRTYREVTLMSNKTQSKLDIIFVGRHGGHKKIDKLEASSERIKTLAGLIKSFSPNLSIGFASPEAARVAFGLNIKHYQINDSPHSEFVAKLTVPFTTKLFTPLIIPNEEWTKYGIQSHNIVHYNSLDVVAWLQNFKPDKNILSRLGITNKNPLIVIRAEEYQASYLSDKSSALPKSIEWIEKLRKDNPKVNIVLLCRYTDQINLSRKALGDEVIIPDFTVDAASLLHYTKIFVGYGGTMTWEAALMGKTSISAFQGGRLIVEDYLVREGLIIKEKKSNEILRIIKQKLYEDINNDKKADKLINSMVNPIDILLDHIIFET